MAVVISMREYKQRKKDEKTIRHLGSLGYPDDFSPFEAEVELEVEDMTWIDQILGINKYLTEEG